MTPEKYRKEEARKRKVMTVFLMGGGEAIKPENMESLYVSVRSWGRKEEDGITFPD